MNKGLPPSPRVGRGAGGEGHLYAILAIAAIALLIALAWPALGWLWEEWRSNETYSHGPLVLLLSAFFAWRWARRRAIPPLPPASWPQRFLSLALAVVLGSLGIVLWAAAVRAHYLALLALIPLSLGAAWYLLGPAGARGLAFPVGYMALAVPLPAVERLSVPLQGWTASLATALARLMSVPATHEGSTVVLAACDLRVGAPCSGLRSLGALLALAALLAYVLEGRPLARWALIALAVPIALLANVGRVLALLLVAGQWGGQAALGLWHGGSGVAFFGLALALLIAASRGLGCRNVRADL